MRLLKESVLQIWKARKATVREEIAAAERAANAIQDELHRLDEAFLFERTIDIDTYDRHRDKLREELTLARIEGHSGQIEELDVEGILVFAELFFRDGIAFDGNEGWWTRRESNP